MNTFANTNREALSRFQETYPDIARQFEKDAIESIHYLRSILGFICASCGGEITGGNLQFFNYSPNTRCYPCQRVNKQYD